MRSIVRLQHQSQLWGQPSTAPPFSYNIWDLHKWGPRSAGVCAGLKPPSLYGTLTGRETSHKLLLLTSGRYRPSNTAQTSARVSRGLSEPHLCFLLCAASQTLLGRLSMHSIYLRPLPPGLSSEESWHAPNSSLEAGLQQASLAGTAGAVANLLSSKQDWILLQSTCGAGLHIVNVQTGCRDPALAAFEAEEVLQRGSLAFVSGLASSVATGVLGIARAAVVGRQSGYRAGSCSHCASFDWPRISQWKC